MQTLSKIYTQILSNNYNMLSHYWKYLKVLLRSFDMFKNYEHRGIEFKKSVRNLWYRVFAELYKIC